MADLLYGFYQLKDILGQPVSEGMIPKISTAITATRDEYNRQVSSQMGLFVRIVTDYKLRYKSPVAKRLQPLDENGRALPTKGQGYYDVAFPIQSAGDAWGANFVTAQHMTVQDVNDWLADSITADKRWVSDHILSAIFTPADWVYTDDRHGDITVKPIANGDAQTYIIQLGATAGATDNHQLAQAADISNSANPFPIIHRELTEHPENGGADATVIVLVASDLMDDIEGLTAFKDEPDRDLAQGSSNTYLTGRLTTPVPGVVRGKANKCWIVEWPAMPSGYMVATTAEADKALGMREYEPQSLKGFFELPQGTFSPVSGTPYLERQFQRHAGFGAHNRVGALAYKVGDANYSAPTGYTAPVR